MRYAERVFEMVGYTRNELGLFVAKIPERKKPVLMLRRNNCDFVIGQLRDQECADALMEAISGVVIGNSEDYDKLSDRLFEWGDT